MIERWQTGWCTRGLALALMFTLLLAAGCGEPGDAAEPADGLTIAVIPKGTTHEFWKSVHAGAIRAQRELNEAAAQGEGPRVEVLWKGPLREDDRNDQIDVVESFVTRGVDGIVLAPLDSRALSRPVAEASRAGIPVVIIDSGLESDEYVSFVATDNRKGGELAGEHLASLLPEGGRVIMLRYAEGSESTTNREAGFMDAIGKHSGIEVVSANQYGGATSESAFRASENLLAPYKNADGSLTIDGIFCPNESTTYGMLRALEEGGHAGTVRFVGFDASEKLVAGLEDGKIHGLVVQNPLKMGYLGVKTVVQHLQGDEVERRIDTGVTLVTPENMNEPEIATLLNPPLEEYLE